MEAAEHGRGGSFRLARCAVAATSDPIVKTSRLRLALNFSSILLAGLAVLLDCAIFLVIAPAVEPPPAGPPPGVKYATVPAKRPIQIRDLLTHTAGLAYGDGLAIDDYKKANLYGWRW
jgi:hypothetical protein